MVFAITRGGSFLGSAVETKTSMLGRSDFLVGLLELRTSNFSFRTLRYVERFIGHSLGS